MSLQEAFLSELSALVGEECWGVVGGGGTGSVISLKIGARTLKHKPLNNPHLSDLVRKYDSAYSLMLWCPWRIDSNSNVVSGSHMENSNEGPMIRGYKSILGQKITTVTCSAPAFDLRLEFANRHTLLVHCSSIGKAYEECYTFGTPPGHYRVSLDGELDFKARE